MSATTLPVMAFATICATSHGQPVCKSPFSPRFPNICPWLIDAWQAVSIGGQPERTHSSGAGAAWQKATFRIELPLKKETPMKNLKNLSILLVEDEANLRREIAAFS